MIQLTLVGSTEVVARLRRMNDRMQPELKSAIERLTTRLQTIVKAEKLSGQVLNVRTGRLRNSIAREVVEEGPVVTGIVSSAVVYARPHEYGFQGTVTVRQHMMTMKQAFGKPIDPITVQVSAHSMHMNLPERSFLRSALQDLISSGAIEQEMEAAVDRASTAA